MMSNSLIRMKALEEKKLMEAANSSEENQDASGSNDDTDPDPEVSSNGSIIDNDPDPDPEVSSKQIPDDIVFSDILTRVPVKSLLRFRSVSKYWKSSISNNPSFSKMHLSHFQTRPEAACLLVLVHGHNSSLVHFLSMRDPNEGGNPITHLLTLSTDRRYMITHNINGISCFHPGNGSVSSADNCAYICSPSVRELIALPSLQTRLQASYCLGVDPLTQEFKVLSFHRGYHIPDDLEAENRFYIIDSHELSWRQIYPVVPFHFDDIAIYILYGQGICVNGFIHWILNIECTILTFCVRDEKFGLMSLPKELDLQKCAFFGSLHLVGGCLTIEEREPTVDDSLMNLWILKDYENQVWVKKSITVPFPFGDVRNRFLRLLNSVHIGTLFMGMPSDNHTFEHVMYCDMEARTWRRFPMPQLSQGDGIKCVTTYAESLFSLQMR